MSANSTLERTIDKILTQTGDQISSSLKESLSESEKILSDALPRLEQEYDKIVADGKKEADKLKKQIVGSSDLDARNQQLVLIEESVEKVFNKAIDQVKNTPRDGQYSKLISSLLDESTKILGRSDITVYTSDSDREAVSAAVSKIPDASLSEESIACLGGVKVRSKDGTMTFDNTLDAKLERIKPLIRKEIAVQFGLGN